MMTAIAIVPILGGLAVAIDFAEMSRQQHETLNALDAAAIATARQVVSGASEADLKTYAQDFFEANLSSVDPGNTTLNVVLPKNNTGGGTLKMSAELKYEPYFLPAFTELVSSNNGATTQVDFDATTEVRLKNTLEVALVLDNSGSMDEKGKGSTQKRIDLLKSAAKELVSTLATQAGQMKQISKPLQFGVVPFAASVNVGSANSTATWMDKTGISPVHHENFDWTTINTATKYTELSGGVRYARGTGWGTLKDHALTRFTLYSNTLRMTSNPWVPNLIYECIAWKSNGSCKTSGWVDHGSYVPVYGPVASWEGCIEARPSPYNVNDAAASSGTPATMFVPMFGPDEAGDIWTVSGQTKDSYSAENSWWNDGLDGSGNGAATRQKYMAKYFDIAPLGTAAPNAHEGPNASCTTTAITPLQDVTVAAGLATVNASIDAMGPLGGTNVPEGMAWGWRVVSGGAPFTEGRADTEKGNDKVVIVLTDGANTYYTPSSLGYTDSASNKSIYSAYGYTGKGYNGTSTTRLFMDTSSAVSKTDYANANYTTALNEQFSALCTNAKAKNLMVMTVSLDLDSTNTTEKKQIDMLTACASPSRFSTGKKLFWNATGATLSKVFKEIADELSNLRIVG